MLPIPRWKDGLLWIFGLLLLAAFLGVFAPEEPAKAQVGPPNQVLCSTSATFTGTGAAASVITAGASQRVYLCGWHITNTAATGTFAITTGTGTNCGTGTVTVTPSMSVTSTAPTTDHIEFATFNSALGGSFCVNATVTTVTGLLWIGVY